MAVKENTDFDCSQCEHLHNENLREEINLEGYWLLFWAIFKPDFYRRYRALEAAHAQSKKRSKPGRPNGD
jgi:hypothetical protein